MCTTEHFKVGRVRIGKGAVIGGFALLGPGIEVGDLAMVAGGAVVGSDVPTGATAIGNPARILRRSKGDTHA
jgi:maltose O-acetyltransferase